MFINLHLDLMRTHIADLTNLCASSDALAEYSIEDAELAINRGLDGEVVLAPADHLHVELHVFETFAHPFYLSKTEKAVLYFLFGD